MIVATTAMNSTAPPVSTDWLYYAYMHNIYYVDLEKNLLTYLLIRRMSADLYVLLVSFIS